MDKELLLYYLALHYGFDSKSITINGVQTKPSVSDYYVFLKNIGIKVDSDEELNNEVNITDLSYWSKCISDCVVFRQSEPKILKFRIAESQMSEKFFVKIISEQGYVFKRNIIPSALDLNGYKTLEENKNYFQYDLPIIEELPIGYHKLFINDKNGNENSALLIITPDKAYTISEDIKDIRGPILKMHTVKTQTNTRIADTNNLKYFIRRIARQNANIIGVGQLNQLEIRYNDKLDFNLPSSKLLFNPLYLSIDIIIKYIEDKDLHIRLLSDFQENFIKLKEAENIDYKQIYELKFNIFKIIYQSFRENHINKKTKKCQEFYSYTSSLKPIYSKLAVFKAIQEYLVFENESYRDWHNWPEIYKSPNSDAVITFENNNKELVELYKFLQWMSDIQLNTASKLANDKNLSIGIYSEIPLGIDPSGADSWVFQDLFAQNSTIDISDNEILSTATFPVKLAENCYEYLIEMLKINMSYTGAIKLTDFSEMLSLSLNIQDHSIPITYNFNEIIAIIALESHRNKCLVIIDSDIGQKYGFYNEKDLSLNEISEADEIKEFLKSLGKYVEADDRQDPDKSGNYPIDKIPNATYRVQFNKGFSFIKAREIASYLNKLGISHCYASPVFSARSESMHCYDIIDHNNFHTQIGSKEDFYAFSNELKKNDLGLIFDVVPNHMGINKENFWWMDVLENGQSSEFASYFDIDWAPVKKELQGKVLVPVLGDHYGNVLNNGELKIKFDLKAGNFLIYYYEHEFPIAPTSYPIILEHRQDVLASRIGNSSEEFSEYQSIITGLKNLPSLTTTDVELIKSRNREKAIIFKRLKVLVKDNPIIFTFINENLQEFSSKHDDPISTKRMHLLLEEQLYRLAYWRVSVDEINYRRFFDVNDLAAICVDNPIVFSNTHNFILELIEQKRINGLRIDHPDGLFGPSEYFLKLQCEIAVRLGIDFHVSETEKLLNSPKLPFYIVVEKILAPFEKLNDKWAIHGTVGYEFLNLLNRLYVNKDNEHAFSKIYNRFINKKHDYDMLVKSCKKIIMKTSLTGELNILANNLNKISENYYSARDYTLNSIRDALVEIISNFPVYRTYFSQTEFDLKGIDYVKWAVGLAKKQSLSIEHSIFDFIEKILILDYEKDKKSPFYKDILNFAMKFQQYTGPLMAKGLEDTAFYRYNRLISLNEVGGDPNIFGINVNDFHNMNINRQQIIPNSMITTSTHDTKRSEDFRARINVLSEIPELWHKKLNRWTHLNRMKKSKIDYLLVPDKNDEYMFYQTLIGIWPNEEHFDIDELIARLQNYMIKAVREAKVHTSWININKSYEDGLMNFIKRVLSSPEKHPFWKEFLPFQKEISLRGAINSLSQTTLKLTTPGVPDIYQGCETWNFSLVDPDNRRQINYSKLSKQLDKVIKFINSGLDINSNEALNILFPLDSGLIKMYITTILLNYRKLFSDLFNAGEYFALNSEGAKKESIIAFARILGDKKIIVLAPRLIYNDVSFENHVPDWHDTIVELPEVLGNEQYKDLFTNKFFNINSELKLKDIFQNIPVVVLSN